MKKLFRSSSPKKPKSPQPVLTSRHTLKLDDDFRSGSKQDLETAENTIENSLHHVGDEIPQIQTTAPTLDLASEESPNTAARIASPTPSTPTKRKNPNHVKFDVNEKLFLEP